MADRTDEAVDALATRIVKLIEDLDQWLRALRVIVPPSKPWQRALRVLLDDADRRMQILRMTEAMGKTDTEIIEAAVNVEIACRKFNLAIHGSRADSLVKASAKTIAKGCETLLDLMLQASTNQDQ